MNRGASWKSNCVCHFAAESGFNRRFSVEDAADILGDTEAIVRKHYAKWSAGRQVRISDLLVRIWYTKKPTPQVTDNQGVNLVDLVRFGLNGPSKNQ